MNASGLTVAKTVKECSKYSIGGLVNAKQLVDKGYKQRPPPINLYNGEVTTDRKNMIIENDNVKAKEIGYSCYSALSYVSSGSENSELTRILIDEGKIVKSVRYSNDRIKYKAAMEYVSENKLVWTDFLSLQNNYSTMERRMRAIGRAYSLSTDTIVILEYGDVELLSGLIDTMVRITKQVQEKTITKALEKDKPLSEKWLSDVVSILSDEYDAMLQATRKFLARDEFSYWSRAWTLQEQHLSNKITYTQVVGNITNDNVLDIRLEDIVNSDTIQQVLLILSKMKDLLLASDNSLTLEKHTSIEVFSACIWGLLSGREQLRLAKLVKREITSMDDVLINSLENNVRCAKNKKEMNEAISIAFSVYADDEDVRIQMIYRKFVENGHIPFKKYFCDNSNTKGWLPGRNQVAIATDAITTQYYSLDFLQFHKTHYGIGSSVIMNDGGSVVLKARMLKTTIKSMTKTDWASRVMGSIYVCVSRDKEVYDVDIASIDGKISMSGLLAYPDTIKVGDEISLAITGRHCMVMSKTGYSSKGTFSISPSNIQKNFDEIVENDVPLRYVVMPSNVSSYDYNPVDDPADDEMLPA